MIVCSFVDAVNQKVILPGRKNPTWFEFSWMFGPLLVDMHGEPLEKQPIHEDHPFWPPFKEWLAHWEKTHPRPPLPHNRPTATDHLDRSRPTTGTAPGRKGIIEP